MVFHAQIVFLLLLTHLTSLLTYFGALLSLKCDLELLAAQNFLSLGPKGARIRGGPGGISPPSPRASTPLPETTQPFSGRPRRAPTTPYAGCSAAPACILTGRKLSSVNRRLLLSVGSGSALGAAALGGRRRGPGGCGWEGEPMLQACLKAVLELRRDLLA